MTLRWLAITCDAQRLLTKSQMWGKLWHATVQAGGWVGVRSGREKRLLGKTPQTAPPGQDRNVVNAATKVDPRAMAEPGSRYPEGDGPPQDHIFHMLPPPVFDHPSLGTVSATFLWTSYSAIYHPWGVKQRICTTYNIGWGDNHRTISKPRISRRSRISSQK